MACGATLKRSIEFDPLHSPQARSPKRRRCLPMTMSPSTPPRPHQSNSPFEEVTPRLSSEEIAAKLSAEIKRMHRRRQFQYPSSPSPPPSSSTSCLSLDTDSLQSASASTSMGAISPSKKDVPLFTFRQVSLMCDRMLKEQQGKIREEYDKVLSCKMAEQYEAFLKFNHDQIQRRFTGESAASYVS